MGLQRHLKGLLPGSVRRWASEAKLAHHLAKGRQLGAVDVPGRGQLAPAFGTPMAVLGAHSSILGIGQGARLFAQASRACGIAVDPIDATALFTLDQSLDAPAREPMNPASLIAHLNPVELTYALGTMGRDLPLGAYRIGYWAWETTQVPREWLTGPSVVDAIWCPSQFTADALRSSLSTDKPIHVVPHPVFAPPSVQPDKARFGLDPGKPTVLCAYDLQSSSTRKNAAGAIEAFIRSGCGARGTAELLLKVHGRDPSGHALDTLKRLIGQAAGIVLTTDRLTSEDMATLMASVDIVLSPHRSEGFGLVLAEAMAAGKAVIATGWSGNVDFMNNDVAALVEFKLVPVLDPDGIYGDGWWAEPELDHMANLIASLAEDRHACQALGLRAQAYILSQFGVAAWQDRVRAALAG